MLPDELVGGLQGRVHLSGAEGAVCVSAHRTGCHGARAPGVHKPRHALQCLHITRPNAERASASAQSTPPTKSTGKAAAVPSSPIDDELNAGGVSALQRLVKNVKKPPK